MLLFGIIRRIHSNLLCFSLLVRYLVMSHFLETVYYLYRSIESQALGFNFFHWFLHCGESVPFALFSPWYTVLYTKSLFFIHVLFQTILLCANIAKCICWRNYMYSQYCHSGLANSGWSHWRGVLQVCDPLFFYLFTALWWVYQLMLCETTILVGIKNHCWVSSCLAQGSYFVTRTPTTFPGCMCHLFFYK